VKYFLTCSLALARVLGWCGSLDVISKLRWYLAPITEYTDRPQSSRNLWMLYIHSCSKENKAKAGCKQHDWYLHRLWLSRLWFPLLGLGYEKESNKGCQRCSPWRKQQLKTWRSRCRFCKAVATSQSLLALAALSTYSCRMRRNSHQMPVSLWIHVEALTVPFSKAR